MIDRMLKTPSSLCVVIGWQILEYFASLNIHIMELFGQSECTGPQTHNTPEAWKMGSCGRPMVVSKLVSYWVLFVSGMFFFCLFLNGLFLHELLLHALLLTHWFAF